MTGEPSDRMTRRMMDAFAWFPNLGKPPYEPVVEPQYDRSHFILSMIPPNILVALHEARRAREHAVSYRDFHVGAATVALRRRPSDMQIVPGINAKPDEDSALNMHAEQLALHTAKVRGFDMVSMLAVVGELQPDTQSGYETRTLHSCGLCRDAMAADPMIDNDATLVFSALPDLRTIEVGTVNGLIAYHRTENPDPSGMTLFEMPELELLTPFVPPKRGVIHLPDTEKSIEEDRYWLSTIGHYVLQHQQNLRNAARE